MTINASSQHKTCANCLDLLEEEDFHLLAQAEQMFKGPVGIQRPALTGSFSEIKKLCYYLILRNILNLLIYVTKLVRLTFNRNNSMTFLHQLTKSQLIFTMT